jgi:hypothetical protein
VVPPLPFERAPASSGTSLQSGPLSRCAVTRGQAERAGIPSCGQLTEDTARKCELGLHDEMDEVVRKVRVVPRCGVHLDRWKPRTRRPDGVAAWSSTAKRDIHGHR